jgi:hypothetical protein
MVKAHALVPSDQALGKKVTRQRQAAGSDSSLQPCIPYSGLPEE